MAQTERDRVAQLRDEARKDYADGAAQRDPRAVKAADATARRRLRAGVGWFPWLRSRRSRMTRTRRPPSCGSGRGRTASSSGPSNAPVAEVRGPDMGRLDWLMPGKDHELAERKYADRESASATARRKDFKPRSPPPRPPALAKSGRTTPAELGSGCLTAAHRPGPLLRPGPYPYRQPRGNNHVRGHRAAPHPGVRYRKVTRTREETTVINGIPSTRDVPYDSWEPVPPREWDDVILRGVTALAITVTVVAVRRHHGQRRRPPSPAGPGRRSRSGWARCSRRSGSRAWASSG